MRPGKRGNPKAGHTSEPAHVCRGASRCAQGKRGIKVPDTADPAHMFCGALQCAREDEDKDPDILKSKAQKMDL